MSRSTLSHINCQIKTFLAKLHNSNFFVRHFKNIDVHALAQHSISTYSSEGNEY